MAILKSNALPAATSWALNSDKMGFDGDPTMNNIYFLMTLQAHLDDFPHRACPAVISTNRKEGLSHDKR